MVMNKRTIINFKMESDFAKEDGEDYIVYKNGKVEKK
jgi:hypothetical protein